MKIIPAIDLIGGKTVRLVQGEYARRIDYEVDPVIAALKWESLGAELLHVVDLDGAREGSPVNLGVAEKIIKALNVPVEIGGGFRTEDDIEKALGLGIWRVIIGSRAVEDRAFAADCVEKFDDGIIFSVDVRDSTPGIRGWEKESGVDAVEFLSFLAGLGVEEVIYTDIKSDGTLTGPNVEALRKVLYKVDINIISAGGVSDISHVEALKDLAPPEPGSYGVTGAIIGRALYEGAIDLREAIDAGKEDNSLP